MNNFHDAFWMPYTPNRQFKAQPRLVASAQGVAYRTPDGREVLDGTSGLWCVGAGHCHSRIAEAMKRQIDTLDFASSFQVGHPLAFELAERLGALAPSGLDRVFLVNSGSEGIDTAMKIALTFAARAPHCQRDFHRGVDALRPAVDQKHAVHAGCASAPMRSASSNAPAWPT